MSELSRRRFLTSCLALAAAPAIVHAESLMKLWVPPEELAVPWTSIIPPQSFAGFYKIVEGELFLMMKPSFSLNDGIPEGWTLIADELEAGQFNLTKGEAK